LLSILTCATYTSGRYRTTAGRWWWHPSSRARGRGTAVQVDSIKPVLKAPTVSAPLGAPSAAAAQREGTSPSPHGQPCSRAHCSTPGARAERRCARFSIPRAAVLSRPHQHCHVPAGSSGDRTRQYPHGQPLRCSHFNTSRLPPRAYGPCTRLLQTQQSSGEILLIVGPPHECGRRHRRCRAPAAHARERGKVRGAQPRQHLHREEVPQLLETDGPAEPSPRGRS